MYISLYDWFLVGNSVSDLLVQCIYIISINILRNSRSTYTLFYQAL